MLIPTKKKLKFSEIFFVVNPVIIQPTLYVRELLKSCNHPRKKPTYDLEIIISLMTGFILIQEIFIDMCAREIQI